MKLQIGKYYKNDDISNFSGNGNTQVGIRVKAKGKRIPGEKLEVYILAFFKKGSYDNTLHGNLFKYHMKDNGGKKKPETEEVNRMVVENGFAHIFLETSNGHKYIGYRKLVKHDYVERYFYFDVAPEDFNESLDLADKVDDKPMQNYINVSKDKKLNEVIFDYFADLPYDPEFEEGNVKHILIKARRRNRKLRDLAISRNGTRCQICDEDYAPKYKDRNVVHVHHIKPLHTLAAPKNNKLDDVLVLCPNCHTSIHKGKTLTPEELKNIINDIDLRSFD